MLGSNLGQLQLVHWQSDTTGLDLIRNFLGVPAAGGPERGGRAWFLPEPGGGGGGGGGGGRPHHACAVCGCAQPRNLPQELQDTGISVRKFVLPFLSFFELDPDSDAHYLYRMSISWTN